MENGGRDVAANKYRSKISGVIQILAPTDSTTWLSEQWTDTATNGAPIQVHSFKVGKFNFEAGMTESDIEVDIGRLKTIAASLLTGLGLNNNPQVAYHSFRH